MTNKTTKTTDAPAAAAGDDSKKVQPGERAVRLTRDISGGVGTHAKGTVLRHLSASAFNTLVQGELGEAIDEGDTVPADAIDTTQPIAPTSGE